ncbi:hypothetical protein GCM10027290_32210 [Micromonospora sonneratiae]|uniref:Probable endolytic peptidoglycan transglycosylase RlpA n=1 Tax=Micromonospora sonneratiae TaxID=1184706 RepID=A0ABW3YB09_9ACTN
MTGKHFRTRTGRLRVGLVSGAAVAVVLAVGGTVGAVQLAARPTAGTPAGNGTSLSTAGTPVEASPSPSAVSAEPTGSPTASPTATKSTQRASRSNTRTAAPSPTSAKKTAASQVVGSGSCGASFYAEGQLTANGETFDPEALTAAHKTLAFDTRVRVTNPANGKSVVVRINDRGPYIDGRCIDLSRAAFRAIASLDLGEINVRYEILG